MTTKATKTMRKPARRAGPTNPRDVEIAAHAKEVEIRAFCLAQTTYKSKMRADETAAFWNAIEKWRIAKYGKGTKA